MAGLCGLSGLCGEPGIFATIGSTFDAQVGNASSFIATWNTSATSAGSSNSVQVKFPFLSSGSYDLIVGWGDGTTSTIDAWNNANVTHTYDEAGTYRVVITPLSGAITGWKFNNAGDKLKIGLVEQWGDLTFNDTAGFNGCGNLTSNATDSPSFAPGGSMFYIFGSCTKLNTGLENWNTTNVTDMTGAFISCPAFNADLSSWDVSNVTTMYRMFENDNNFNRSLNTWNTASLVNSVNMFYAANKYNQPMTGWDMSGVTNMNNMFYAATAFAGNVSTWQLTSLQNAVAAFMLCSNFNSSVDGWNTTDALVNCRQFFRACVKFNSTFSTWNTSKVTDFFEFCSQCTQFNSSVAGINTNKATTLASMFPHCPSFNQDLSHFLIANMTSAANMLVNTGFGTANYDLLLVSWEGQVEKTSVPFHAGGATYSAGAPATARGVLVNTSSWTITDGGPA